MLRCPVCRAENGQGPNCRRCKADLSLLFALEQQREGHVSAARQAILTNDWSLAEYHTVEASTIRNDVDISQLEAMIALLRGDFPRAWARYPSMKTQV
jgi:hypothetical protein